jgi:hypothetical protein
LLRQLSTGGAAIKHQDVNDLEISLIEWREAWVRESGRAVQHGGENLGEQALPNAKVAR